VLTPLLGVALALLSASPAPPLLVATRGDVSLRDGSALSPPQDLAEGALLRLGEGAGLEILQGSRWFTYAGSGELRYARGRWERSGQVTRVQERRLGARLRSDPRLAWEEAPQAQAPKGSALRIESPHESAIQEAQPTLRWSGVGRKSPLRVDLLVHKEGRLVSVERWRNVTGTSLRVHASLEPETFYLWRVEDPASSQSVQSWFLVRDPTSLRPLVSWLSALGELTTETGERRLGAEAILAVALERLGLLEESRRSWRALASGGGGAQAQARSEALSRRRLLGPRARMIMPLPFGMRLDDVSVLETSESKGSRVEPGR